MNSDKSLGLMPVLFVGHGSPMNSVEKNSFTDAFSELGRSLTKPKAILAISAHWVTRGSIIQNSRHPKTIYDFSGFPDELYRIKYSVDGDPNIASDLSAHVPSIVADDQWGLDHGTWSVLVHMYPNRDIPVLQLSLNANLSFEDHINLGKELYYLRKQGVLVLGSGNIVHNLRRIQWDPKAPAYDWNLEFDQKIRDLISRQNFSSVAGIEKTDSKLFAMAHPSSEHFLPLLYVLGAAGSESTLKIVGQGSQNASISMTSFLFS